MSETISIVTPPGAEPVTTAELSLQLQLNAPGDSTLLANQTQRLQDFIWAARESCEDWTRRAFVTQTWKLARDSFPGHNLRYDWNGYPEIWLPKAPFQSVVSFTYIDVSGAAQTLTQDTTYGVNPQNPQYGYQLERGSETQPARLLPPFARPWPPTRLVPSNVIVVFRCGFGGPVTVSLAQGSAQLEVSAATPFLFDADDAPLLPTELGLPVYIPGAGAAGAPLITNVASVSNPGTQSSAATLAATAATAVTGASAWLGLPVPHAVRRAILLTAEWYWEQGSVIENELPAVARALLGPWRNLVA